MSKPYSDAADIPVNASQPVLTYTRSTLEGPVPARAAAGQGVGPRGTAPNAADALSHGHGQANFLSSYNGYGPLANFFAAHGFAVIQPTHLDSTALGLRDTGLRDAPLFWRDRATDMHTVLDRLDDIQAAVPGLAERRIDRDRVGAVGHSLGVDNVLPPPRRPDAGPGRRPAEGPLRLPGQGGSAHRSSGHRQRRALR
ncbi:hypothetical protein SFUMM280S_03334 [Streptomyces fumanus]